MKKRAVRSKGIAALSIVILGTACCGAAVANPIPPAYQDFPTAPSEFVSHVPTPLIADDFEPGLNGKIAFVEWWGSLSDGPWEITLYANADPDPASPDDDGASIFVGPLWVEVWEQDLFHYAADVSDLGWTMIEGESYWLSVASFEPGWTWALGDGVPDFFGAQRQLAVGSLDAGPWAPLDPPSHLAFVVWPTLVPEPGAMMLTALGLVGLGLVRRRCGRAALASAVLLGVTLGYPDQIRAAPLYVAKLEAVLDSGFGGLPPTLLQVTYVFEDEPPSFSMPHEAYYEFRSITVRLNGVEFPALPLEIGVQDNLPYFPGTSRDAYFVVGTVAGTFEANFELLSAGLEFVKFGNPPEALSDLGLPKSVGELSGFTVESELDHRLAFLSFENLSTGGLFASSGELASFTIEPVAEPGVWGLVVIGVLGFSLSSRLRGDLSLVSASIDVELYASSN